MNNFYGNIINYLTKSFKFIKTSSGTIKADTFDDEVELRAGDNITITANTEENAITISANTARPLVFTEEDDGFIKISYAE